MPSGKNKLEKTYSKSLKADEDFWGMKLHNNMLAHQTTPADYIQSYEREDFSINNKKRLILLLVECKQVTCKDGKGRLAFKRLKQMHDLLAFYKKSAYHRSYFCLGYHDGGWTKGEIYLVPAFELQEIINKHSKVSLNRDEAKIILSSYRADFDKQIIDLSLLKEKD